MHSTTRRPIRAITVLCAGLGAIVTITLGLLFLRDLELLYYRFRLRFEPSFLLRIISEPEATPGHLAASEFLEERRGLEVLFHAYVTHLAEEIDHRESDIQSAFTTSGGRRVWFDASYSGRKLEAGQTFCEEHAIVPAIKRFLPRLEGAVFRVPGVDDFEFSVLTTDEAVRLYRRNVPDIEVGSVFTFRGGDPYVCRVRRTSARAASRESPGAPGGSRRGTE